MQYVAAQTPTRLLFKDGDMGVVVEVREGGPVKHAPFNFQSILARGYWETPEGAKAPDSQEAHRLLARAVEVAE